MAESADEDARPRARCVSIRDVERRIQREADKRVDRFKAELVAGVVELLDDLERANRAAATSPESEELAAGVRLIERRFHDTLGRLGVEMIDPAGEEFDARLHEAVAITPCPARQDGRVMSVERRGYRLGDTLVRPAAVVVGKASRGRDPRFGRY